jgi:hypothetical protein
LELFKSDKYFKMKIKILILSTFILITNLNAQSEYTSDSKHEFGINAGYTTGIGFSYRYWPGLFGIQATILPVKTDSSWVDILNVKDFYGNDDPELNNKKLTSLGLTALLTLQEGNKCRFFSYLGNHYIIRDHSETYNIGLGIGLAVQSRVSFNFMAGYAAYDVLNSYSLLPTIEFGLYYRFKRKD